MQTRDHMQTRDQKYAIKALEHVEAVKGKEGERKYGTMCHKLPILIHTAGLAQALAFVESRKGPIYGKFLNDLQDTVGEQKPLPEAARTAPLNEYMRLTSQVMAALVWYKRFAQSVLGVDVSEADEEEVAE